MSRSDRQPTQSEAEALNTAVVRGYEQPCDCHVHAQGGALHPCPGHEFLLSDPTRRGLCKQWQRLLFMRAERARLLFEEGVARPVPGKSRTPTRLPW
jgi:hypothetical protein